MRLIATFLLTVSSAAWAQNTTEPLSGAAFEAWVTGQTYYSSREGEEPYGMLLYLENRQVTWASFGDDCVEGFWTEPQPGVICFDYPSLNDQFCWQFYAQGDELFSTFFEGDGSIYYDQPTNDTLPCLAPYLGA